MIRRQNFQKLKWLSLITLLILILAGCNLPQSAPSALQTSSPIIKETVDLPVISTETEETAIPVTVEAESAETTSQVFLPQIESPKETPEAETTNQVFLPQVESAKLTQVVETTVEPSPPPQPETTVSPKPPQGPSTELAYLHAGNLFLIEVPSGSARQLTDGDDLLSFTWSPDGNEIAIFNGKKLCFVLRDGSSGRTCLDLALEDSQANIPRQILWSPDQTNIVLWNDVNPWDEDAIGWLIVSLEKTFEPILIKDPVDWGLEVTPDNDPGGITGQPIFLPDGTLVGTMTHRWLCGSGGCHYQLQKFDMQNRVFSPYPNKPEEGFSEGQRLVLDKTGNLLINYGTFMSSCDNYFTFVDLFQIQTKTREIFNLTQEAVSNLTLSPDNKFAVIARTASCSEPGQITWASSCGLSTGPDIFPMQIWEFANNTTSDLVPGNHPVWSPNGSWLAFNSCLTQNEAGDWQANSQGSPEIFVRSFVDGGIINIAPGTQPSWRP